MSIIQTHKYQFSICTILSFLCVILLACGGTQNERKIITVSIQPQKYLLEQIVGDKYDVICLLSKGSNPEAYEPNMSHLLNVEKSQAFFRIGNIGFELAILNKIQKNNPNLPIYNNSEDLNLIEGGHSASADENHTHEIDPHVWSSIPNMMVIAKNMYDAVVELDPANEKYYSKNYDAVISELLTFNDKIARQLAPKRGSAFAVWHPSLSYFARDYGLKQVSMEYDGKESSIKHMRTKIDEAKKDSVKIFFFQKEFDGRQAEVINDEIGAKLITINPMNYNWKEEIQATADAIAAN